MDDQPITRVCTKCGESKPLSEYYSMKHGTHGTKSQCKKCCIDAQVAFQRTPEGKEKRAAAFKARYHGDPAFREAHADRQRAYFKTEEGRLKVLAKTKAYQARNAEKLKQRGRAAYAIKSQEPLNKCQSRIRAGLRKSLKTGKTSKTFDLLGYTAKQLHDHLEKQFTDGMSWGNMNEWHIDHIVPLSSFKITSEKDESLRRAWCLTNLRPLWAGDNMRKHAKIQFLL